MRKYHYHSLENCLSITSVITFFNPTYKPDFYFNGEMHPFWEAVYVLDGKIGVAADNRIHTLSKGQIIFHKPMEFHSLWAEGGTSPNLIIFSFNGEGLDDFENAIFSTDEKQQSEFFKLLEIFPKAFHTKNNNIVYSKANPVYTQLFRSNLELLFLSFFENSSVSYSENRTPSAQKYHNIINVMEEHKFKRLTLPKLAILCNMSESNLKKIFRKFAKIGVMEYFNHIKIREAIRLLEEGLPIREISDSLGFMDQNYFSRVFKREMGISPTGYRNQYILKRNTDL